MYRDRFLPQQSDGILQGNKQEARGTSGKKIKLSTNCFRISWKPQSFIHHYVYELSVPDIQPDKERLVLEKAWESLKEKLQHFVVRCPGHIFSPNMASDFSVTADIGPNERVELKVCYSTKISGDQINTGAMGAASVVSKYMVDRFAEPLRIQKVGKRYYSNCPQAGKGSHILISGSWVSSLVSSAGPLLQLDMIDRPVRKQSIVQILQASLEGADIFAHQTDRDVAAEWIRCCVSATVVTSYNSRVYRIKQVHFDKDPSHTFMMYQRDQKEHMEISFAKYYEAFYHKTIANKYQPLLEAYPEKETEKVFLLPELCSPTGITEDMRKEKQVLTDVLKQLKVQPQERLNSIFSSVADMQRVQTPAVSTIQAWGCSLEKDPLEVQGRVLDPLQVCFKEKNYVIEEGNFTKYLRHAIQVPIKIDHWLVIYLNEDEEVLKVWLKSIKDIAQCAFSMSVAEPHKVECNDQYTGLSEILQENVKENTQLVMLITKENPKIYQLFKQKLCCMVPCISQVVKSETIRKRNGIAATLSRLVLQMNAKFCGPLWHIAPVAAEDSEFEEFRKMPFMIVGVDVYQAYDGMKVLGLTATLDKSYSQYFSESAILEPAWEPESWRASLSVNLQRLLRDAIACFARCNDKILPENIIVYRASVNPEDWPDVAATELEAVKGVAGITGSCANAPYEPKITFITIAKRGNMRLFYRSEGDPACKNPEPGTVVDDPAVCAGDVPNFYLISQAILKGSAIPAHFSVFANPANHSLEFLQNLTNRLCLMYYTAAVAVRLPAPVVYAKKLASFVGSVIRKEPHPSLQRTLFYL